MITKVSVVVPVRDEAANILRLHDRIMAALQTAACLYEIIFVDDGSSDASPSLLARLQETDPRVTTVLLGRRGQAAAYQAAFARASGDIIVTLDADLENDPADIPLFLSRLQEGFDFVSGWRTQRRTPWFRQTASWLANKISGLATGSALHDYGCGFNAFKTGLCAALSRHFDSTFALKCALICAARRPGEISIGYQPRQSERSKYGPGAMVRAACIFLAQLPRRRSSLDPFLVAILIVAAGARFWAVGFGLPNPYCRPDEGFLVGHAMMALSGAPNPGSFVYPSLYIYILAASFGAYFLAGLALGRFASFPDLLAEYVTCPTNFYLLDRVWSASLGTATVGVVYALTLRLFDKTAARIAAFFMAGAFLCVRESHFGATDTPMTFLIMCSMLFIIKYYQDGGLKDCALAGLFAGLAASTKYAGIFLAAPLALAYTLRRCGRPARTGGILQNGLFWFGLSLLAAFFLGTPFAVLSSSRFLGDLLGQVRHLFTGHFLNLGRGWHYHIRFSLYHGLGWSLLAASLAGLVVFLRTKPKEALIFCAFPAVYYVVIGLGYTTFVRYALPLVPFLCIAAAASLHALGVCMLAEGSASRTRLLVCGLALALTSPSWLSIIRFDHLLSQKDNRLIAAQWITRNIPARSSIVQGSLYGALFLAPCEQQLRRYLGEKFLGQDGAGLSERIAAYMRRKNIPGYEERLMRDNFGLNARSRDLPDYIILIEHPLLHYGFASDNFLTLTRQFYHLRMSFIVIHYDAAGNLFDQLDAFYAPFAGFDNVDRPGPNIYIYEKNSLPFIRLARES